MELTAPGGLSPAEQNLPDRPGRHLRPGRSPFRVFAGNRQAGSLFRPRRLVHGWNLDRLMFRSRSEGGSDVSRAGAVHGRSLTEVAPRVLTKDHLF